MERIKKSKIICLISIILLLLTPINNNLFDQLIKKTPNMAGSTSPVFSNFSPYNTENLTPNVFVHINDTESGLNINSEYFAFSTNGSDPTEFCNPHRDDFDDSSIAEFWSFENQDNGTFIESGDNITITDLDNGNWVQDTRTAPFMYQTVSGDFDVQVKLSANLESKADVAGLLIRDKNYDFIRVQYIWVPGGADRQNIAFRYSLGGSDTLIKAINVGLLENIWIRIERTGDEFIGFYSLNGYDWNIIGLDSISLSRTVGAGIYVGSQINASFDDWKITPWINCTGTDGTNSDETFSVYEVPFNQESEYDNKIKLRINDTNNNMVTSSTYTVNITKYKGPADFSEIQPNKTEEKNPDVQISVQDDVNGIDKYSIYYAFSKNGKDPSTFMNPYSDSFNDGKLQNNWELHNPSNGILKETNDGLNFTDSANHIWDNLTQDAPCITQDIAGSFQTEVKMNTLGLGEGQSAGLITILDNDNILKLILENNAGIINLSYYYITEDSITLLNSITPLTSNPIWLRILRDDDDWMGLYSLDGDTYSVYDEVGSITLTSWDGALLGQSGYYSVPNAAAKVGLIVENGSSIIFHNWAPTPEIIVSGINGSTSKEQITVSTVKFDQFSQTKNKIQFCVNSTNKEQSYSSIYTINCTSNYIFRDKTLLSDGETLRIIDGEKNEIWSMSQRAGDKEMLPNGNLLIVSMGQNQGANAVIREINISNSQVVWEISSVGNWPLNWTHDVDYLGFDDEGNETYLIADTSNNRVVEFYKDGTVKWEWNASSHYTFGQPVLENDWDWTHLNDADRLPDGSTMISLRNFDKVIIVNTTETGEILWEFGEYENYNFLNHQHNPEYSPWGTIIIADSDNNRIIDVNMTTKEIIWEYKPNVGTDEFLGWPRDADVLPNGNMLICDSARNGGKNRIWEINMTSKEALWYYDTTDMNYDADRLDNILPTIKFNSPDNITYTTSMEITISLQCEDIWYDEMFYRIYDDTDGMWLSSNNISYGGPTQIILENKHTYTLHAWANDIIMEGGAYPTSRAIIQKCYNSTQFLINLSTNYDPSLPYPGNTLITYNLQEVSPTGDILWSYLPPGKIALDAEKLPSGNYLFSMADRDVFQPLYSQVIEMTPEYEIVWEYTITGPLTYGAEVHDVDKLSNGNYLIADMSQDRVIEVSSSGDIVWEWRCIDHLILPPIIPDDWVHLNDVDRLPNGNTLITLRNYDSIIEVNSSGDIVWHYGDLLYNMSTEWYYHLKLWGPHNADRLSNGHTLIADSMNHRIIEVNENSELVWQLNQSHIDLLWPRDCDKLPNGNILIADSLNKRIIEVNSTYDIVWEYVTSDWTYDADRIDITPPTIEIHSLSNNTVYNDSITVNITSPDFDTDTIWYKIFDQTSEDWVDLTSQGGSAGNQIYDGTPDNWTLPDGDYILYVWANDTGYPILGSDYKVNTRELLIYFKIGLEISIISPKPNMYNGNSTLIFSIEVNLNGILNTTWYALYNGSKWSENKTFTGLSGTVNQLLWDLCDDGKVTIRFFANLSTGYEIFKDVEIYKDTIAPTTIIQFQAYSNDMNSVLGSTLFYLNSINDAGSGVNIIRYQINDSSWIDYENEFTLSGLSPGDYLISYYSIDSAGNVEEISSILVCLIDLDQEWDSNIIIIVIVAGVFAISIVVVSIGIIKKNKIKNTTLSAKFSDENSQKKK